jgi:hypothetical protein
LQDVAGCSRACQYSRTRLAVIGIPLTPHVGISCAPVVLPASYSTLFQENIDRISRRCRESIERVPSDLPVEYRVAFGRPDRVVDSLLEGGGYWAVVVQEDWVKARAMRRAINRWRQRGIAVRPRSKANVRTL